MSDAFSLGEEKLTPDILVELSQTPNPKLKISDKAIKRLQQFRKIVENTLQQNKKTYGINTGFGYLSNVSISSDGLKGLQKNLILSHACAIGSFVDDKTVRALLILRAHTFLLGNSGISESCLNAILHFLKEDILPLVPIKGSVGASGDLAPLAHLALPLLGEGEVRYKGTIYATKTLFENLSITPYVPQAKEGLSLINGTHFMTTLASFACEQAKTLCQTADIIAGLSLDATKSSLTPFDPRIHQIRPHAGQKIVSENMRNLFFQDDQILESHHDCDKVQDPYSFRCIPQVHGACRDAYEFVKNLVTTELNSVTDNPLVFEDGSILSGGNFHGEPVAMAMDFLAIAMSEIGNISERRIEKMTSPHMSGLPAFLVKNSGLNSGFMIPHVTAAALASENKVLSHPASVDSIPTSAEKEDHVSMGPIAGKKLLEINNNVSHILAIELLAACQGIELLLPLKPSKPLLNVYNKVREHSKFLENDRSLHKDIESIGELIRSGEIIKTVLSSGIPLQ